MIETKFFLQMPDAGALEQAFYMRGVRVYKRSDDEIHWSADTAAYQQWEETDEREEEDAAALERGKKEQARLPFAVPSIPEQSGLCK